MGGERRAHTRESSFGYPLAPMRTLVDGRRRSVLLARARPFAAVASIVGLAPLPACSSSKPISADSDHAAGAGASAITAPIASPVVADAGSRAPSNETVTIAQRIAGSVLVGGQTLDSLRDLTDGIGPRLTGSAQLARAAAWGVDRFHAAGLASAAIESFPLPATWSRRPTVARVVAPEERAITSAALGWMPPTPPQGIRGELVRVTDLSLAGQKAAGERFRGKILIFDRDAFKSLDKKLDRAVAMKGLADKGASAIVLIGGRDNDVLGVTTLAGLDLVGALPAITIGKEDGAWIVRQLEKGPVTLELTDESPLGGAAEAPDVVAEIRGRERPEEWLLVGAHLDSWDLATGAQDNGSGVVEVLEAARAINATGTPPRRSIRFALWGGEEEGLFGSRAYAARHAAELDRLVFVLNSDHGAGAPKGWNLDGREDLVDTFKSFADPFLAGLGATGVATEMTCDTDHCPFMLAGVPTANLDVEWAHYMDVHHTPGDTFEKVSSGSLASAAAILAVTAYAIADAPDRFAKRLDHAAVAKNLKKAGLADELASGGYWKK
jgi:carboxypeptidase Q